MKKLAIFVSCALLLVACAKQTPTATTSAAPGTQGTQAPAVSAQAPAPTQAGAAATSLNPCKLLTVADIQSASGVTVNAGVSKRVTVFEDTSTHCTFAGAKTSVIVVVHDKPDPYPGNKPALANLYKSVEGVGAPAVAAAGGDTISWLKDGVYAQVEVVSQPIVSQSVLVKLAKAAADRMP